jgi:RNA polymerase primary sigma factor
MLIEELNKYEQVSRLMENFSDIEKMILTLRFGLDDEDPQTLETIGRRIGVTRERIRQIESRCLSRLRKLMRQPKS